MVDQIHHRFLTSLIRSGVSVVGGLPCLMWFHIVVVQTFILHCHLVDVHRSYLHESCRESFSFNQVHDGVVELFLGDP